MILLSGGRGIPDDWHLVLHYRGHVYRAFDQDAQNNNHAKSATTRLLSVESTEPRRVDAQCIH